MKSLNWPRVILGGVVWFVAYNALAGAAWFAFLRRWGVPAFHPLLGSPQSPGLSLVFSVLLLTLTMGIFALWLYAAIYRRSGTSRMTFVHVSIALWLLWGLMPNWPFSGISVPGLVELVSKLVVLVIATWSGTRVYRESAPDASTAS